MNDEDLQESTTSEEELKKEGESLALLNSSISKPFVETLASESRGFCIIGLTGKVRSGTSGVCSLLTDPIFHKRMMMPDNRNALPSTEDYREYRIIFRYLRDNWKPFVEVSVTSVILSYLFDLGYDDLLKGLSSDVFSLISQFDEGDKRSRFIQEVLHRLKETYVNLHYSYREVDEAAPQNDWQEYLEKFKNTKELIEEWKNIKTYLDQRNTKEFIPNGSQTTIISVFVFCFGILPVLEKQIKYSLKENDQFPSLFQDFGNCIRATGGVKQVLQGGIIENERSIINAKHLFSLSERINQFIKILRDCAKDKGAEQTTPISRESSVFVVINNFKNYFEAYYFKKRYAAFYLVAVSCDENARKEQFKNRSEFEIMRLREELSVGKRVFKKAEIKGYFNEEGNPSNCGLSSNEEGFMNNCKKGTIRYHAYKNNLAPFILQDVVSCIENSDIFVTYNYEVGASIYDHQLIRQLARIVTLILHPGLLVPTKIERCMQIAMTAKLNSGCLSRQVGAVVTDADYNILSLGWNDSPCGTEPCLRRNLFDVMKKEDADAYSDYELYDPEYRAYLEAIAKKLSSREKSELKGLPMAFCFKDIYQDLIMQRDQIYTRSLHGEERAIASCNSNAIKGGYLFTTSSPCELCAKRAKEAGISKIYYIELYPGISKDHVIQIGNPKSRAQYEFFVGATGLAYIKLYTPLISYKDELAAFGYSPKEIHDRTNG